MRRKDALARKGNVSAGRRKPVEEPPIDAPTELLATAVAGSNKKAHSLQQTETTASRTKTTRAAGRASGKETVGAVGPAATADELSAMTAEEAPEVEALAVVETEVEVDAFAIVEETTIVDAPFALAAEAATSPSTAIGQLPVFGETRGPPLVRTAADSPAPAAPALHQAKRALVAVVSRLLSALSRWTGVRP